jgi:hypothetical protein
MLLMDFPRHRCYLYGGFAFMKGIGKARHGDKFFDTAAQPFL